MLVDPQVERVIAIFNSVAASPNTTRGMGVVAKRAVAVLAPLGPFLYNLVAAHYGLPRAPKRH
jgi:hypothetical protein